jgi:hypothetical protein
VLVHNSYGGGTTVTSDAATLTVYVNAGTYNGLFSENEIKHASSGFFTFALASTRSFTGSIKIDGGSYVLSGLFNASTWLATSTVLRTGKSALTVNMQLIQTNETVQVAGSVTDGSWTAPLRGDRAYYTIANPAPPLGKYTLTLIGDSDGAASPGYGSYGMVTIGATGSVTLTGVLSDTASVSQITSLSKAGLWPLYVPLYAGKGSLLGWVTFTNAPTYKLTGDVSWIKTNASGLYYSSGFTNAVTAFGSVRH